MRAVSCSLACVVAVGCATTSLPSPVGTPTHVVLLDGGFVRFEGARIPREGFLYEIRRRVRAAAGDAGRLPAVRILIEVREDDPGLLDALLLELERSGVKSVTLG